jgi:hypothetical protein
VRERIEYRFRVPSAAVFTLYSYSKALEYRFRVPSAGNLRQSQAHSERTGMGPSERVPPVLLTKALFRYPSWGAKIA